MTEAEANEFLALWVANSISAFSVYLSLTFAYMTVAYVVGSRLSRFQALAVSTLYVAGTLISLLSIMNSLRLYQGILEQSEFLQRQVLVSGDIWSFTVAPVLGLGIFVSLYFMWNIRHPKTE
jgi:hypothetical protein